MGEFSVTEVALTGFRVVRAHPRALLAWAPLMLLVSVAVTLAALQTGVANLDLMRIAQDPQAQDQAMGRMAPFILFSAPLIMLVNAVLYAAMNRAVLDPAASRFGYLRLGADELRQLGLQLAFTVVLAGVYLAVLVCGAIFTTLGGLAGDIARNVFAAVALVAGVTAVVATVVRLSLAFPLTFASGRIGLTASWRLTRGRAMRMFLAYALATVLALMVAILGAVIEVAVRDLIANFLHQVVPPAGAPATIASLTTPASLAALVVNAIVSALMWPVVLTPPAAILARVEPAGAAPARAA